MHEVDLNDPNISAAFDCTVQILENIQRQCTDRGVDLLVMLFPTRESVYSAAVQRDWPEEFLRIVAQETLVRTRLQHAAQARHIRFLDVLSEMVDAVEAVPNIYADYDEGHPLCAGYSAYATAAARALRPMSVARN